MDLEGITLKKLCETKKDKYHMISLIGGMWKKKQQMNQQNKTETDPQI